MGNDQSNSNHHNLNKRNRGRGSIHFERKSEVVGAFNELNKDGSSINRDKFQKKFGYRLGQSLWEWMMREFGNEISLEKFEAAANTLLRCSSRELIQILMPSDNFLQICLESGGIASGENDDKFIGSFKEQITFRGADSESVSRWIDENCPRLIEPVRNKIHAMFHGKDFDSNMKICSEILVPAQMFILCHTLPTTIFAPKPDTCANSTNGSQEWLLLYSSSTNGLSINRFETNVFDYRGPTVAIFRLSSGEISAIASDEEWRNTTKPYGGPNSVLFKFSPEYKRFDLAPPALYCNFKNRSSKMGIKYGNEFSIKEDMSDVEQIEVWGCAGSDVLNDQKKMKLRYKQQAERNAKVPLPGNWNDSPDKAILDMAGIKFHSSAEHRLANEPKPE